MTTFNANNFFKKYPSNNDGLNVNFQYRSGVYSDNEKRAYFIPSQTDSNSKWHYINNVGNVIAYENDVTNALPVLEDLAYEGGAFDPINNRVYFTPYGQSSASTWHYLQE